MSQGFTPISTYRSWVKGKVGEGEGVRVLKSYPYQEWQGKRKGAWKCRETYYMAQESMKRVRRNQNLCIHAEQLVSLVFCIYFWNRDYPNLAAEKKMNTYWFGKICILNFLIVSSKYIFQFPYTFFQCKHQWSTMWKSWIKKTVHIWITTQKMQHIKLNYEYAARILVKLFLTEFKRLLRESLLMH